MTADRSELYELVEKLPDSEVGPAADDLRRRLGVPKSVGAWPPEFFGIIDNDQLPGDIGADPDRHLAALGFGRDSL